ncbi:MAG: transposase [Chloroflexi bacterium]|nr:transposase [Chloroflexota bacterium]
MNEREQRGLEIAALTKLKRQGGQWFVPSQSNGKAYIVNGETCTCPDHEFRHLKCKHIWAVEFTLQRERKPDGTVTETKTVRIISPDWPAYNAAQTNEKSHFMALLHDLCQGVPEPPSTFGRPRLPMADMVFSTTFKVYSTVSGRRFISDLRDAQAKGYISKAPHFNSIFNYLEMPELTPVFNELITASSLPLKEIEEDFAVDSSGFGTPGSVSWRDMNYRPSFQTRRDWLKAHIMCGVRTNIVTAVEISDRYDHDGQRLPSLVEDTARHFRIAEVSADKAYSSKANLEVVDKVGGMPYIPFKRNTALPKRDSVWGKVYRLYSWHYETFMAHYHKRSNVEATFAMIKGKFGDYLRSKTRTAQVNELLCKVLAHNICVVIASMYELGVEPTFCAENTLAQKVT